MKWMLIVGIIVPDANYNISLQERQESHGWTSQQACIQAAEKLYRDYLSTHPMLYAGCQSEGGPIILPQAR